MKISRGQPLTETVKGSLDYTMHTIRVAFHTQFRRTDDWFWIQEIFSGYVIVKLESQPPDEFYKVAYQRDGYNYTFAPRDSWEVVELAYQPQTVATVAESNRPKSDLKPDSARFVERVTGTIKLDEAVIPSPDGPWRIQGWGITAGVVNGNGRRYARHRAGSRYPGHPAAPPRERRAGPNRTDR